MERELCLVLDTTGKHRLVLESGSNYQIDAYTSKYFENSSQIRECYKEEIEAFLESYKEELKKSNKPDYTGRIVIVIPKNIGKDMNCYQRRVLYKKHIVAFNQFLKDREIMIKFSDYEKAKKTEERLVSNYLCALMKQPWTRTTAVRKQIEQWIKGVKEKKDSYYEIVRDMMSVYEKERQYKEYLMSIDELYLNYKEEKLRKTKERIEKRKSMKLQNSSHTIVKNSVQIEEPDEYVYVNGIRYTIEELHLFDLEQIESISDCVPDGIKKYER